MQEDIWKNSGRKEIEIEFEREFEESA